jgi:excisionase family DNA binding protein
MDSLLVNDREASRLLGVSRSAFYSLVARGAIPRIKIGRSARYRRTDLVTFTERLAAASGVPPPPQIEKPPT